MHDAGMPTATLRFRLPVATEIKGGELGHDVEVAYQELREWLRSQCAEHGLDLL